MIEIKEIKRNNAIENKQIPNFCSEDVHFYIDLDGTIFEWLAGEDYTKPHYFRHLPPIENMVNAVKILKSFGFNVAFATAVTGKDAIEDKRLALNDIGFAEIPMITIPYGENKDDFLAGKIRILCDDHTPNCASFTGKAVKFVNAINHRKGVWKGTCVYYNDDGLTIALDLIKAAFEEAKNKRY